MPARSGSGVSKGTTSPTVKPVAVEPLVPGMRVLLYVAAVLVLLAGFQLFVFTDRTATYFAWTVRNPLAAAFLGGAYWASVSFEALAARQRIWPRRGLWCLEVAGQRGFCRGLGFVRWFARRSRLRRRQGDDRWFGPRLGGRRWLVPRARAGIRHAGIGAADGSGAALARNSPTRSRSTLPPDRTAQTRSPSRSGILP